MPSRLKETESESATQPGECAPGKAWRPRVMWQSWHDTPRAAAPEARHSLRVSCMGVWLERKGRVPKTGTLNW